MIVNLRIDLHIACPFCKADSEETYIPFLCHHYIHPYGFDNYDFLFHSKNPYFFELR